MVINLVSARFMFETGDVQAWILSQNESLPGEFMYGQVLHNVVEGLQVGKPGQLVLLIRDCVVREPALDTRHVCAFVAVVAEVLASDIVNDSFDISTVGYNLVRVRTLDDAEGPVGQSRSIGFARDAWTVETPMGEHGELTVLLQPADYVAYVCSDAASAFSFTIRGDQWLI